MERLTFVDEDGQVLFDNPAGFPEDIGFTICELAKNEEWEALNNIAQRLANCEQRLKHYEDLNEQGRLLILPCVVGDTVYEVQKLRKRIQLYEIISLKIGRLSGTFYYWEAKGKDGIYGNLYGFASTEIGKTVFLTREAAEAALKEL